MLSIDIRKVLLELGESAAYWANAGACGVAAGVLGAEERRGAAQAAGGALLHEAHRHGCQSVTVLASRAAREWRDGGDGSFIIIR